MHLGRTYRNPVYSLSTTSCLCSPEEPRGGGKAGGPQHHSEECNWLSAEPHQRGSDHHCSPSFKPPTYTAVCACWRWTGGTHTHTHTHIWIQRKPLFITEPIRWQSFQLGLAAIDCLSFSHGVYSNLWQQFFKTSLSINWHLGHRHLLTIVFTSTWVTWAWMQGNYCCRMLPGNIYLCIY